MTSRTRTVVRAAVQSVVEQLEARQLLSLTVDLRLPGGGKLAEVTGVGQVIEMELWAVVGGANGAADDDGLQTVIGAIESFKGGGIHGDLAAVRLAPFIGNASSNGAAIDLDGDGDLDVGSNDDGSPSGFFLARASTATYEPDHADGGSGSYKLADVRFRVTKLLDGDAGATAIRFVPRRNDAGALWIEDGNVRTPETDAVATGAPLVLRRAGDGGEDDGLFVGLGDGGRLVIDGTDGDDDVTVRTDPADAARVQVLSGGDVIRVFDADDVEDVIVRGWGGDDTIIIDLGKRTDTSAVVSGGDGNDVIQGGGADDTLKGDAGDDAIEGAQGDDKLVGGDGDDTITGNAGADTLSGGAGEDVAEGSAGDDAIAGGQGDDWIDGNAGDDEITGGADDDWIEGGAGEDDIAAGSGDDEVLGGGSDDEISGGAGDDSVAGGAGEDTLRGDGGDDEIAGGIDDDVLRGKDGEDTLFGGDGADTIAGGADTDVLNVEQGVDYTKGSKYDTVNNDKYKNPLANLEDVDGLKSWLIEQAVKQWKGYLGQKAWYGYWWRSGYCDCMYLAGGDSTGPTAPAVPVDHSTTNTQEADVDEADLVKTDGDYLYLVSNGELVIVDAWPAEQMHVVSRTPVKGAISGIYLAGDTVTVVARTYHEDTVESEALFRRLRSAGQTQVSVFDVSDRGEPALLEETTIDGNLGDTRMVNGRLYVVLNNWNNFPEPLVILPEQEQLEEQDAKEGSVAYLIDPAPQDSYGTYETEAAYRARLEAMSLEELLPGYVTKAGGETHTGFLADLSNFYVPEGEDEDEYYTNMFSVVMFDVKDDETGVKSSTSVAGVNGTVYASTDSLYVTATSWGQPISSWDWRGETQTDIYKFDLGATTVKLGGGGQVPGWIINSFALDDEEGILRIATTSNASNGQSNNVFTLADTGKDLEIVGGITDLAFSERIYSVRFVGDRGYLVTFRQTDPLFTIDLSDPANPEVKGILKIPGYSSYLHPIDGDLVIGVGRDATETGQVRGVQVSLFDVSDMENPKRLHTHTFHSDGQWQGGSWTAAEWDHHAFSYFPRQQVLALPMMTGGYFWDENGLSQYGLQVLRVDREDGFSLLGTVEHTGQAPLRSLRIGDNLYSIGYDAIRVVDLETPSNVLKVLENVITPSYGYYYGGPIRFITWFPRVDVVQLTPSILVGDPVNLVS